MTGASMRSSAAFHVSGAPARADIDMKVRRGTSSGWPNRVSWKASLAGGLIARRTQDSEVRHPERFEKGISTEMSRGVKNPRKKISPTHPQQQGAGGETSPPPPRPPPPTLPTAMAGAPQGGAGARDRICALCLCAAYFGRLAREASGRSLVHVSDPERMQDPPPGILSMMKAPTENGCRCRKSPMAEFAADGSSADKGEPRTEGIYRVAGAGTDRNATTWKYKHAQMRPRALHPECVRS
eukprot:gene14866-biopygen10919